MRRYLAAAVLAALAVLAVPVLPASAATQVVLTGRVVDASGRPVSGARVTVSDDAGALEIFASALACVFGGFFVAPEICGPYAVSTTTRGDGSYRVTLPRKGPVAQAGDHDLYVEGRAPGRGLAAPYTRTTYRFGGRSQALPTMSLWTAAPTVRFADGRAYVEAKRPPGATSAAVDLRAPDGASAWTLGLDGNGRADVDERVFETGTATMLASAPGRIGGRTATWRSPVQRTPTRGTPSSRRLACSTYTTSDALAKLKSCPFTDGALAKRPGLREAMVFEPAGACHWERDCTTPNTLVFDLGSVRVLRAVVLRGDDGGIEFSADGLNWARWPLERREGTSYQAVVTGPAVPARYLRLRGDNFTTWNLREISIWSDPLLPAVPALPAIPTTPPAPVTVPAVPALPMLPALPALPALDPARLAAQ